MRVDGGLHGTISAGDVIGPWVIVKAKPGTCTNVETGKKTITRFEGVIIESMEKADRLYYLRHDRISALWLSD